MTTALDIRERGKAADGTPLFLERRLFMQFLAFGKAETGPLAEALDAARLPAVLYEDINDPFGAGVLFFHEDPGFFLTEARQFLRRPPFAGLTPKPEHTMLGRTYALGHEQDLELELLDRPRRKVCNPAMPWAIWYPLRRAGSFEQLSPQEQRTVLMEHGGIGHAYGRAGFGTDVRLACHGLDKNDNDFVIGLIGPELYPLSTIVERMRKTKQTSLHLERLGPFFAGRAVWQPPADAVRAVGA
jgi:chlorite dismutase